MGMTTAGSREINVTPLIDVLLVLLIIFLVMMPIMIRMEPVALPPESSTTVSETTTVGLKLQADLSFSLDDGPMFDNHELAFRLRPKLGNAGAVFVDINDAVPWAHVIATVDTVRGVASDLHHPEVEVAVRLRNLDSP
jgi:biopolymer transport protein ExbD